MKQPEKALSDLVQQWIAKADLDRAAARQLAGSGSPLPAIAAFHAQQAAEKCLKAFLSVTPHRIPEDPQPR